MGNSYHDQEKAIREVGKGYDILKQLKGIFLLKPRTGENVAHTHELAEPLFREALQALNQAFSIMKSGVNKAEIKSEVVVLESGSPVYSCHESVVSNYDPNQKTDHNERGKRRRVGEKSWTGDTTMPYDDGYQWRKYGDKKIIGTNFSRGYFRCTYKEQGCEAKKVVQQVSNTDPHMFTVTYTNTHTCNFNKTISPSSTPQSSQYCSIEHDSCIYQMQNSQECKPSMPKLLSQGSCSSKILTQIVTSSSTVDASCEWDWDFLLRDLSFPTDDFLLI